MINFFFYELGLLLICYSHSAPSIEKIFTEVTNPLATEDQEQMYNVENRVSCLQNYFYFTNMLKITYPNEVNQDCDSELIM